MISGQLPVGRNLPPDVTVLPDKVVCRGPEKERRDEIVYDLAPGCKLFFSTANGGPGRFAENILDLRDAGCNIWSTTFSILMNRRFKTE
jgi:hypothetical protein